jgi:hypothetical protein
MLYVPPGSAFGNVKFCPQSAFVSCVVLSKNQHLVTYTALTDWFFKETECIYCVVRVESSHVIHVNCRLQRAVPRFRQLVAVLLLRKPLFDPRPVRVKLWWTKWRWDVLFSDCFGLPWSVWFHKCSIVILICMLLLPEGQTCQAWEKYFRLFLSFKL